MLCRYNYVQYRCGRVKKEYGHNISQVGNAKKLTMEPGDPLRMLLLAACCPHIPQTVFQFWRLKSHDNLYYSCNYSRMHSRNSYTVCFGDQFGIIEYFLEARSHSGMVFVFAVVKVLSVTHALNCTHLFAAKESGTVKLVPVTSIVSKCVCINVGTELFVGTFPCHFLPMLS